MPADLRLALALLGQLQRRRVRRGHGVGAWGTESDLLNVIAGRRPSGGDIAWLDSDPPDKAERFGDIMEVAKARGLVVRTVRMAHTMWGFPDQGTAVFVAQGAAFGDLFA